MNVLSDTATHTYIIDTTCSTAHKGKFPSAAHAGILIMKKIPPSGSSHYGSGFTPSSPGYSYGDVHDSPPHVSSYPDFKPIGHSPHPPRSHKPSYASLFKGVFSASSSPKVKPAHSNPPPSHIYHGPTRPHSSYPGSSDHSSGIELDYDPTLTGPKYPSDPGSNYGHPPISDSYGAPPSASALSSGPPSTKYGYPIGAVEPFKIDHAGHSDTISYHNAENVHQVANTYNNQPLNFAEQTNQAHISHAPAQIHITPTTNFIEYTNIQNADSPQNHHQLQQQQSQLPPPQSHSHVQHHVHQAPTTSQQMAEEVIKYLGNLQQGASNNKNPQLFFGMNVPLVGDGTEVQDESFPLYPPGTNPQHSGGHQIFAPTPLPEDNSAPYPPSAGDYSGEQIPSLYNHNTNTQYPVDSYGNPVQISKSLHKNHQNYNNHNNNNDHVQFLKPPQSKSSHHSNGVSSSARHKTKPEFDIVRSVSYELGAAHQ